jgi:hypothetical protein
LGKYPLAIAAGIAGLYGTYKAYQHGYLNPVGTACVKAGNAMNTKVGTALTTLGAQLGYQHYMTAQPEVKTPAVEVKAPVANASQEATETKPEVKTPAVEVKAPVVNVSQEAQQPEVNACSEEETTPVVHVSKLDTKQTARLKRLQTKGGNSKELAQLLAIANS